MEEESFNLKEQFEKTIQHSSVNFFRPKKNFTIEKDKKILKKRSSSMLLNSIKNFVPTLKPKKEIIPKSPFNLNEQSPKNRPPEIQNTTISTASIESQRDYNYKPIKSLYRRKKSQKNSFKIEEETYAKSDCERENENSNSKKELKIYSDSDSSKSDDENEARKSRNYKSLKFGIFQNIKRLRKNLQKIRNNNKYKYLFDDSNINNRSIGKKINQNKNIRQQNFISRIRKNKIDPLDSIKNRTKSFCIRQRYILNILDFLEKNNSTNSFNSNKK